MVVAALSSMFFLGLGVGVGVGFAASGGQKQRSCSCVSTLLDRPSLEPHASNDGSPGQQPQQAHWQEEKEEEEENRNASDSRWRVVVLGRYGGITEGSVTSVMISPSATGATAAGHVLLDGRYRL
jgi:hypothetical protein